MKTAKRIGLGLLFLLAIGGIWAWTPDLPRDALEAAYLRAPGDIREVDGVALHVRIDGPEDAPAVVMLHGLAASLHTWEPWAEALAENHRVIRLDLPGAALSGPDPTGLYTDARAGEVIAALLDDLGIARAALVGNSLGGRIAWRFADAHPDRVTGLVLISPDGFTTYAPYGEQVEMPAWVHVFEVMMPRMMMRLNLEAAYADPERLTDPMIDRYHDLLRVPGVRTAWIERMGQTVLPDPADILPGITAPVLLVWGDQDRLIPVSHAEDYLALLPNARLVRFPDLGHVPQEEDPAKSLPPVRAFLAEL